MVLQILSKIGKWNGFPHTMRKMTRQYFVRKINRPDYPMDNKQYNRVIIVPADHNRINAQYQVQDT
jgi:hypothetical protein